MKPAADLSVLRQKITQAYRMDERACVEQCLSQAQCSQAVRNQIHDKAYQLVKLARKTRLDKGGLDAFLVQYDLSSDEGIALMCLAEALLRIPDKGNIDRLIRDKISNANWGSHLGASDSLFVNAATWGLMLTGKILHRNGKREQRFVDGLKNLISRSGGELMIRKAVGEAMKIMSHQYVKGRTIAEALENSQADRQKGYRFSYDMLGEAARTDEDAQRYFTAYREALIAIGEQSAGQGPVKASGISVKLSALHPRYEFTQREHVLPIVIKCTAELARLAKGYDIGLTIDAEEANRLDLQCDVVQALCEDGALAGWDGLGLAVQAYQKRAHAVLDWLYALARQTKRKLMVRLVKGAYWDTEIKDAQVQGFNSYPVFTRKSSTDVCYLACVNKLSTMGDVIYPQFATHNDHSVATVMQVMADKDYEFQCLHGMGDILYDHLLEKTQVACRVYAPVGRHEDLLPYLVRRLLENGANTSFVNRLVDEKANIDEIIADPLAKTAQLKTIPHPNIPLPPDLFIKHPQAHPRKNSRSLDLANRDVAADFFNQQQTFAQKSYIAKPTCAVAKNQQKQAVNNPANLKEIVGDVLAATVEDVEAGMAQAVLAAPAWDQLGVESRAACLDKAADLLEANLVEMMTLIAREGGRTLNDALTEVREAVDFCRYYAGVARSQLGAKILPGPTGETNTLCTHGRGVIACISPWNFPLAIFTGQVVAALVAGNAVIAKPAAQTPLIAARMIELLHRAGVPKAVAQLMPGKGSVVGNALVNDKRINGIVFTGSTETAWQINQNLANRRGPIEPLIAETGGQNCMIADSTALPEQLVMDVISSAFFSAGQRCSALRVLFIQEDIADKVMTMLKGAMAKLQVGNPLHLSTDIGPVIDTSARDSLQTHIKRMDKEARLIFAVPVDESLLQKGSFLAPRAYELKSIAQLTGEVFGPVLHVIRFKRDQLQEVIDDINSTGFGLTFGIQSRIETTIDTIHKNVYAGNTYVNRNMIGAMVGVQPFGGEGLSGTGPKAGGPHYLFRMCKERTMTVNTTASGGNATLLQAAAEAS